VAVALAHDNDGLALAGLIGCKPLIAAALGMVRGLAVAADRIRAFRAMPERGGRVLRVV